MLCYNTHYDPIKSTYSMWLFESLYPAFSAISICSKAQSFMGIVNSLGIDSTFTVIFINH